MSATTAAAPMPPQRNESGKGWIDGMPSAAARWAVATFVAFLAVMHVVHPNSFQVDLVVVAGTAAVMAFIALFRFAHRFLKRWLGGGKSEPTAWKDEKGALNLPKKIYFWTILLAGIVALQVTHNEIREDWFAAGVTMGIIAAGALLMYLFTGLEFPAIMVRQWRMAAFYTILYLMLGVGFVGIRWGAEVVQWKGRYEVAVAQFMKERGISTLEGQHLADWQAQYPRDPKVRAMPDPTTAQSQERMRRWLFAWPFSGLQWFFGEFFANLLDWIVNFTTKMTMAITDWITRGLPGLSR